MASAPGETMIYDPERAVSLMGFEGLLDNTGTQVCKPQ